MVWSMWRNWYQFFTRCEKLVPIFHSVKFAKCEICGSTGHWYFRTRKKFKGTAEQIYRNEGSLKQNVIFNSVLKVKRALVVIKVISAEQGPGSIDVPRPLTNDLWVFLFQTIDAEFVKWASLDGTYVYDKAFIINVNKCPKPFFLEHHIDIVNRGTLQSVW